MAGMSSLESCIANKKNQVNQIILKNQGSIGSVP
jgi:hypothetical protein